MGHIQKFLKVAEASGNKLHIVVFFMTMGAFNQGVDPKLIENIGRRI